jgi:hypothetical protein
VDTVGFSSDAVGFFKHKNDFARWIGVTPRTLLNWIDRQEAPRLYEGKIQDAGNVYHFPIDPPPASNVIGKSAYTAIDALRRGDYEVAEAISFKALNDGADWHLGRPSSPQPLEAGYLRLANAVAWVRSPSRDGQSRGYDALRALRRSVHRKKLDNGDTKFQYWFYLTVISTCYALVRLAIRWEERIRSNSHVRARVMRLCKVLLESTKSVRGEYVTALVAWNVAQFAALDNDEGMFIDALERLVRVYGGEADRIIGFLNRDDDTRNIMKSTRVRRFIERACSAYITTR